MTSGLDDLEMMVRDLWPTYKASIRPMWDTQLCRYGIDVLGAVLRQHRSDYPDDKKPVWRTIYVMLSGGHEAGGSDKSDLQELLDFMRRMIARTPEAVKNKPIDQWTDADCFERHVEANTRPGLYGLDGHALPDPDARRARFAATERKNIASRYIRDLEKRGEPVPEWLVR